MVKTGAKSVLVLFFAVTLLSLSGFMVRVNHHSPIRGGKIFAILHREAAGMTLKAKMEVMDVVHGLSAKYHLDPLLIMAIIHVESRFKPEAASHKGALGLMQVKPIVVREVAGQLGIDPKDHPKLLTSKEFNLRIGIHYLAFLLKKFKGDLHKALMAYNRGPTAVTRLYRNGPVPTGGYQGKVLKVYAQYTKS